MDIACIAAAKDLPRETREIDLERQVFFLPKCIVDKYLYFGGVRRVFNTLHNHLYHLVRLRVEQEIRVSGWVVSSKNETLGVPGVHLLGDLTHYFWRQEGRKAQFVVNVSGVHKASR